MTYLSASKRNKKSNLGKIILGVIVVALMSYIFVPSLYDSLMPVFSFENNFSFSSKESEKLIEENSRLQREVLELRAQVDAYGIYTASVNNVSNDRLVAKVLKRPPYTLFDTLLIDRGRIDGVDQGMQVYIHNTLLGNVKEVFENTASVELITYPGNVLEAIFPGNVTSEIKGIGNGAFEAAIPKDIIINKGDLVTGTDRNATLYGVIDHIEDQEGSVYRRVFIDSPFNIYKESWVEIKIK